MNTHSEKRARVGAIEALLGEISAAKAEHGAALPLDDLARRRMIDEVLSRTAQTSQHRQRPYQRMGLIAAAVALLALGAVLWQASGKEAWSTAPLQTPRAQATTTLSGSRFVLLEGEVRAGSVAMRSADALPTDERIETSEGRAVVALPRGIAISTGKHTRFRVRTPAPGGLEVSLEQGEALFAVEPLQGRDRLTVTTPLGRIEVKGTVFTVVTSAGGVEVQLHEGSLELVEPGGVARPIAAGERAVFGDAATTEIPKVAAQKALVRARELMELELGTRVMPLLVKADEARTSTDASEDLSAEESAARSRRGTRSETHSIKELMLAARTAKSAGEWLSAARIYEELIASHHASAEAGTSLVSLGQIELARLGRPAAALGRFEAYLEAPRPGALAREALYGKAQALFALGRSKQERQALEEYVRRYSDGTQIAAAKKRLAVLKQAPYEPKPGDHQP